MGPIRQPHPGWRKDPPLPIGRVQHLVYGECHEHCGFWAALPEGAVWPKCPGCGAETVPPAITEHVRYAFAGADFFREDVIYPYVEERRRGEDATELLATLRRAIEEGDEQRIAELHRVLGAWEL